MTSKINNFLLVSAVLSLLLTPVASAQSTLTWIGNQTNSANVSGVNNWLGGAAPANDTDYDLVFDAANLVPPGTNVPRTSAIWNRAVGVLSLSFAGNETYPSFTFSATSASMMTLKGGITVTSGGHRLDNLLTVGTDAEWNIAAGSSLTRAGNVDTLTMAADRKITKTGAGTLVLQQANANMLGTLEVQQGVLQVRTVENALGGATLALNGGTLEIFSNNTRTNNNATTTVIGESMVRSAREAAGAGLSHVMGALQLGSSKLTVTANELNTSGTADVTFGNTTLSNDATLEVVNNGVGTSVTQLTLGAVGETGGARGLTKTGTGVLVLSASNSYSGLTAVSAGTLVVSNNNALGGTGQGTTVDSGARLGLNNVTVGNEVLTISGTGPGGTSGALGNDSGDSTWGGLITLALDAIIEALIGTSLTLDVASGDAINLSGFTATFSGGGTHNVNDAIAGTGGLTKAGTGTLNLAARNRFTGATAVTGGVLNLNSSAGFSLESTASVSVTDATLLISQSDQVNDTATVTLSGGTIQRGAGVSEVFGNLNIATGSFLDFGTGATGNLTFGTYQNNAATPSALLTLNNFLPGNSFTFNSTSFNTNNVGSYFDFGTGYAGSSIANTGSTFTITAIPEPSTYLAAAGLLAVLMWPSRRRLLRAAKSVLGFRATDLANTSGIDRGLHR